MLLKRVVLYNHEFFHNFQARTYLNFQISRCFGVKVAPEIQDLPKIDVSVDADEPVQMANPYQETVDKCILCVYKMKEQTTGLGDHLNCRAGIKNQLIGLDTLNRIHSLRKLRVSDYFIVRMV